MLGDSHSGLKQRRRVPRKLGAPGGSLAFVPASRRRGGNGRTSDALDLAAESTVPSHERPAAEPSTVRAVAVLVVAGLVVRAILAAVVPLGVDEAYYVDWARHLQLGYLDHPPLVAWLIAAPLRLLGATPFAVRLSAVLLQAGTTLLAASLARAHGGERAALLAAVLLQAAPVFSVGAVLMTPDAPLAFAWAGALWAVERALRLDRRWLLAAGAFLGMAALSKLTAGLLGVALLLALAFSADGRRLLATPWPWLGAALALALTSPMLLWNAAHGWPSFAFQAHHGMGGRSLSLQRLVQSIGAQAAYVSPILLALAAAAALPALRPRNGAARLALGLSALPVVAFFTVAAAATPGALPHWPGPGWLSALILLAASGRRVQWLRAGVTTGLAMVAVLLALVVVPLPLPRSPLDEMAGWREGAMAARAAAGGKRIAAVHWIVLGEMGWYLGESVAYLGDRRCAASFYQADPRENGEPLLLVSVDGLDPSRERLEERLGPLERTGTFTAARSGHPIRSYSFWMYRPPHLAR